jgi:hypothetical protein
MDRTELPLEPHHLGVLSSAFEMISMPMVCSVQTVHQSWTDTNTVCKRAKTRFHTTHVTYEFHRVRPKLFMSLWFVPRKQCTYLASRIALSPNGPNRAPPDPRHLGVPSGASKMIHEPIVSLTQTKGYLGPTLTLSQNRSKQKIPHDPRHLGVSLGASNTISEPTVHSTQTVHQSCIKSCTISKRTEPSFYLSLVT